MKAFYCIIVSLTALVSSQNFRTHIEGVDRVLLLQIARLGLANRLRTMADWHQVARRTNRY